MTWKGAAAGESHRNFACWVAAASGGEIAPKLCEYLNCKALRLDGGTDAMD
jgi:hypothetical protein